MKIEITNIDHLGNGIGKINNKIIFIPKGLPGDICEIEIVKDTKKYSVGRIKKIISKSKDRITTKCPYFDICGGCNISNLEYSKQLEFKEDKVKNIFKKYLNMDISPTVIRSVNEYNYRNKITFHCVDNMLGLVSLDNEIIDINKCLLVSERVNKLYNKLKKEDLSRVKKVVIKECDNGLILDIDGSVNIDRLKEDSIEIYINNKLCYKKDDGYIKLGNISYMVSNRSFFQINTSNIHKLYDEVVKYCEFKKTDKVIDLYCGVGSISLYISQYVKSVLGIEIIEDAVDDARKNALINNIDNAKFLCGDVSKLIDDNISGDILIVDPPRIGLDKHTVEVINKCMIPRVIYVSCDPMTLVRDIKLLGNYKLKDISIIDMFPGTHHVECVTLLCRKTL